MRRVVLGLLATGLCAAPASAGVVSRPERVPVSARGLTAAERRAITISVVTVTSEDSVGVVVRVAFKGDLERYLGRGHLNNGLLALVLVPARGGQPAGLVEEGGARVLRVTAARPAGVIRRGNQVVFYVGRTRLSPSARIEIRVLATEPGDPSWRQILGSKPIERVSVHIDRGPLTCSQLTALGNQLRSLHAPSLAAQQRRVGQAARAACAVPPAPTTPAPPTATTTAAPPPPAVPPEVTVVQTDAALSQQMAAQPALALSETTAPGVPLIDVNDQVADQRFAGLGAALTDSAAWLIYDELSSADRTALMQELFGAAGIHLNFLRIAMGASGAMTVGSPYSYDEMPSGQTDPSLANFSISHDQSYIIPTLQQALSINPGLQILANPWSPPGWMKANDSLGNQNDQGTLLSSDYPPLADYFVEAIQQYAAQGIPIDAITPQNEPRTSGSGTTYPGLTLPEPDEAQFIAQNLAPALSVAGLRTKIYGNDLSWDSTAYANGLTSDSAAGRDLAGIAWHCYFGSPTVMTQLEQMTPGLDQIVDECSPEIRAFGTPEFLISSLRNWASAVSVWTAATDPSGGPIQSGNNCGGCRGLVTVDENAHTATLRTEYYQLGQVSSFVQPGAHRIDSPNFVTYGVNGSNVETVSTGLDDVAFLNPDGSKVLVAYNNSSAPIPFAVQSDGRYFTYTLPAQAMTTFSWR